MAENRNGGPSDGVRAPRRGLGAARHRFAVVLAALGLVLAGAVAGAAPASASASGCSAWAPFTGGPGAGGSYCVTLAGSSTYVMAVGGSFASTGSVCNWHITAEFFDKYGRWYQTFNSGTHWGCYRTGNDTIWLGRYMGSGFMCSTLYHYATRVTSVCHNIYA